MSVGTTPPSTGDAVGDGWTSWTGFGLGVGVGTVWWVATGGRVARGWVVGSGRGRGVGLGVGRGVGFGVGLGVAFGVGFGVAGTATTIVPAGRLTITFRSLRASKVTSLVPSGSVPDQRYVMPSLQSWSPARDIRCVTPWMRTRTQSGAQWRPGRIVGVGHAAG